MLEHFYIQELVQFVADELDHIYVILKDIILFTSGAYSCICLPEVSSLSCPGEALCHL